MEGRGCGWEQMKEGRARAGEERGAAAGQRTTASSSAQGVLGRLKRAKGGEGGGLGCRRALVVSGVLVDGANGQQRGRLDGMGGKVSGACTRGTHGRAVLAGMAQRAAAGDSDALLGPALGK